MDMIRIGMIGTGRIAQRFIEQARIVAGMEVTVIYNPRIESAKRFAKKHDVPEYTDDIGKLADLADAVYIASPHETHYSYAGQMLHLGKHVLCEKPLTMSETEARDLYELAIRNHCVLMEAVKTEYCPGFIAMMEMAKSGKIGKIVDVEAAFTKLVPINSREYQTKKYGGSFTELGTYTLLPILSLLGNEYETLHFYSRYCRTGVDSYTKAYLTYGDKTATCKTGIGVKSEGQLLISGTEGYILAASPWWLTRTFQVRFEDPNRVEEYTYPFEGAGMIYELAAFRDKILTGRTVTMQEAQKHITMARTMEQFLKERPQTDKKYEASESEKAKVKIWAHRGCSRRYPENTLVSFEMAAKLPKIEGIELDVQLTKDGQLVVIHDEKVDRTTDGHGAVKDLKLSELKQLKIKYKDSYLQIPSFHEVLEVLEPYCKKKGLLINVELKTSIVRYEGIEEMVVNMVDEFGLADHIIYSSFLADSIKKVKELRPDARTGMLAGGVRECLEGMKYAEADAIHPYLGSLREEIPQEYTSVPVRAWNVEEELYDMDNPHREEDLRKYCLFGVTDIITNEPEKYLAI